MQNLVILRVIDFTEYIDISQRMLIFLYNAIEISTMDVASAVFLVNVANIKIYIEKG